MPRPLQASVSECSYASSLLVLLLGSGLPRKGASACVYIDGQQRGLALRGQPLLGHLLRQACLPAERRRTCSASQSQLQQASGGSHGAARRRAKCNETAPSLEHVWRRDAEQFALVSPPDRCTYVSSPQSPLFWCSTLRPGLDLTLACRRREQGHPRGETPSSRSSLDFAGHRDPSQKNTPNSLAFIWQEFRKSLRGGPTCQ